MSYQEKRIIVSIITGVFILVAYCTYVYGKYQAGAIAADDLKFWAATILIFIGIGIVASIVIQIIFHISLSIAIAVKNEMKNGKCDEKVVEKTIELEMVEDEMDKLIGLKSLKVGFAIAGVGFIAAMGSLVLNFSSAVMINIIFLSFSVGSMIEGFTQLYFYRRGVKNGK